MISADETREGSAEVELLMLALMAMVIMMMMLMMLLMVVMMTLLMTTMRPMKPCGVQGPGWESCVMRAKEGAGRCVFKKRPCHNRAVWGRCPYFSPPHLCPPVAAAALFSARGAS